MNLFNTKQLFLAVFFILPLFALNQVNTYTFSHSNGVYSSITGGTLLGSTTSDDQYFVNPALSLGGTTTTGVGLPIGFNFVLNSTTFDRFAIQNNGWIVLGQSSLTPSVNILSSSLTNPISATTTTTPPQLANRISALGMNLQAQSGSELRYETIGTAPNRILVIEWKNYRRNGQTGDNLNFQIRLSETSNLVEVIYGTFTVSTTIAATAQVGLRGVNNTDFNSRSIVNGTNTWGTSYIGTLNTSSVSFQNTLTPSIGQRYIWKPSNCTIPTGLSASAITTNSVNLSWSPAITNGQIVIVPQGNSPSTGSPIAISTSNATINSLASGTNFSAYIRNICGPGDTSNWSSGINFSTLCSTSSIPWNEGFELSPVTATAGPIPNCWFRNIADFSTANGPQSNGRSARTGSKYLYTQWSTVAGTGDWALTPGFDLVAGQSYDFSFYYKSDGLNGWDSLRVGVGTAQTVGSMSIIGNRIYNVTNTAYQQYFVSFIPTTSGVYHFGINVFANTSPWYMSFDDFNLKLTPTCPQPSLLNLTGILDVSANLSWTSTAPGTSWYVSLVPQGFQANQATAVLTTNQNYSFTGLTANTNYTAYVREYCSIGDSSVWSSINFSTVCSLSGTIGDISQNPIEVIGTNFTATGSNSSCFTNTIGNASPDVWYRVILDPCASSISANLCTGSNFDTYLRIYSSDGTTQLSFNDDGCGAYSTISNLSVLNHDTVFIVVEGFSTGTGNYTLNVTQSLTNPIADFSYIETTYCENIIATGIPVNNGTNGGEYSESSNSFAIDPVTGQINLGTAAPGIYPVIYTVGRIGCQFSDTSIITINSSDNANFNYLGSNTGIANVCSSSGLIYPTITGLTGGTFTSISGGLVLNSSTGEINTLTSVPDTSIVQYSTFGTCPNSETFTLVFDTLQNATIAYAQNIACLSDSINITTDTIGTLGGIFSSTIGLSLNPANGEIDVLNSSSGNYTVTYTTPNTCANQGTASITINSPSAGIAIHSACGSFDWIDGNTYTTSNNTATFVLTNSVGCDSIVTLNLTINNQSFGTDVQTACGSFDWIDGNTYTTSNNTATFILTNSVGCDSIVTLNLTINNQSFGTDVQTACGSYTWIDGNTYTTSNNTATFILTNSIGCDSIVTLDLTINNITSNTISVSGIVLTSDVASANYIWLNCDDNYSQIAGETGQSFTPIVNGNFAVEISQNGCIDTSSCIAITSVELSENYSFDFLSVYPNPTNGNVTIDLGEISENTKIVISNNLGQEILTSNFINSQKIELKIDGERGTYFAEIILNNGNKKIVKLLKY